MNWLQYWWTTPIAGDNDLQHLLGFVGILLLGMLFSKLVQLTFRGVFRRWTEGTDSPFDDALVDAIETPLYYALIGLTIRTSIMVLSLPAVVARMGANITSVVITVFLAWGVTRVLDAIRVVFVVPFVAASETKLDDQLVPIADKTLKAAVWCMAILMVFSSLGYDILSLLTGLGIGGLAVAMAAQATLSNLIGSATIFADQPFQVDDLISVGDHTGVVTDVGLRACRIETFEGFTVTIPNAFVVDQAVVNRTVNKRWRHEATIGLVYDSSAEQIEQAIGLLRQIFDAHPQVDQDHSVWFLNFADSALEITYAFFVPAPSVQVFLDTQSEVNLSIKREFDAAGLSMAFPSVSLYVESTP